MSTPQLSYSDLPSEARADLDTAYGEILTAATGDADSSKVAALRLRLETIHLRVLLRAAGPVTGPEKEIAALKRRIHELESELAAASADIARLRLELDP